ncbi:MAG: ferrous iron transport protein A [Planctomycetia bacterium]
MEASTRGPACPGSLDRLDRGAAARVADVAGSDAVAIRLLEMGLTPGVLVRLVGRAPLGDPLEFEVRGYRLSLRQAEAARVALDSL